MSSQSGEKGDEIICEPNTQNHRRHFYRQDKVGSDPSVTDAASYSENLSDSLLLMSLSQFYKQKGNIERIIPVINCASDVSLRLLDWFVINYAKKKNIIITKPSEDGISTTYFNVYLSYRAQLKAYSKQHFDPFRRRDRIDYYYEKDKSIQTTIGQLNFFRWVLQNGIMEYISEHAAEIESDMMRSKNKNNRRRHKFSEDVEFSHHHGDGKGCDQEGQEREYEYSHSLETMTEDAPASSHEVSDDTNGKIIVGIRHRSYSIDDLHSTDFRKDQDRRLDQTSRERQKGGARQNHSREKSPTFCYKEPEENTSKVNHITGTHIIRFD